MNRQTLDLYLIALLLVGMVVFELLGLAIPALLCLSGVGVVAFMAGAGYGPWRTR